MQSSFRLIWLIIYIYLMLNYNSTALGQISELIKINNQYFINIKAKQIIINENIKIYIAEGDVEISFNFNKIYANRIHFNYETLNIEAEGQIQLITKKEIITGDSILINLQNGTGKIYNGTIIIKPFHYYIRGEEIKKNKIDSYHLRYGSFTTCSEKKIDWEIKSYDIEIDINGYTKTYNTFLYIRDIPILWLPYTIFSTNLKLQNGFLFPQIGYSNDNGFLISQPWFQTISENQDATFTINYISKYGLDTCLEYRYYINHNFKGIMMLNYLPNNKIWDNYYQKKDKKYNQSLNMTNYWLKLKNNYISHDDTLFIKSDLDLISHHNYLKKLNYGYTSYDTSKNRFEQWIERSLDPISSNIRENKINFQYYGTSSILNFGIFYYDDINKNNKIILHYFPTICHEIIYYPLNNSYIFFYNKTQLYSLYRKKGSYYHIFNLSPTLTFPLNFKNYLEIEPSLNFTQYIYKSNQDEKNRYILKLTETEKFLTANTTISSYLYKIYLLKLTTPPLIIKHIVRPTLTYLYKIDDNEKSIMHLLNYNRQNNLNKISYALDNSFINKKNIQYDNKVESIYNEFLKFNISHNINLNHYSKHNNIFNESAISNTLDTYIQLDINQYVFFQGETSWNLNNNYFESINTLIQNKDNFGNSITLNYQFTKEEIKQISTKIKLALNKEWFWTWINQHDLDKNNDYKTIYEIGYKSQCWGIKIAYQNDFYKQSLFLSFSLGELNSV